MTPNLSPTPSRPRPRCAGWQKSARSHTLELLNGTIRATILLSPPPAHHTLFFLGHTISSPSLPYLHSLGASLMRQVLLDALFRLTPGTIPNSPDVTAILAYAEAHAADHTPDCSADSTCQCTYAPRNHSVNLCLNFLVNLLGSANASPDIPSSPTPTPDEKEERPISNDPIE